MLDDVYIVRLPRLAAVVSLVVVVLSCPAGAEWKPAQGPLMTRWAKEVSPQKVHAEYPRPQMVREDWLNLNGLWDYAITPKDTAKPQKYDGQILVPFPVESALSGVMKPVGPDNRLWYRRTFTIPEKWKVSPGGKRLLLHFGAVDWDTIVWVNRKMVAGHQGGYDPFTFDITDEVEMQGLASSHEIVIMVRDPTDAGTQPRGKQVRKPEGIWYTAVTGIWQTVWLEPVFPAHVASLTVIPDIDKGEVRVDVSAGMSLRNANVVVTVFDGTDEIAREGMTLRLTHEAVLRIRNPKLWSPESPFLYTLRIELDPIAAAATVHPIDRVESYFAMRKISLGKDENGVLRLCLNNKPLFEYGPLDQGWWPDGLYTAPTDEALKYDVEVTKQLGMNMARKHVKVEPDRWYYWCDKLGLLVWQDMPSGDRFIAGSDPDITRSEESARQFDTELTRIIEAFRNHPSIVMWVPFNEGWGQFDTPRVVDMIRKLDPTRLVDSASGWTDRGVGDVHDIHAYPGPAMPPIGEKRAAVLGEFGGLGLPLAGHTWQAEKNWGYRSFKTQDELTAAYLALIDNLRPLIGKGLAAAVYTQTTDVEIEVNGLMTYDREIVKMDADKVRAANQKLYLPPPVVTTVVPASQQQGQDWRYTTTQPAEGWEKPEFNDSAWKLGKGGFGTRATPGAIVSTLWDMPDIWLRRSFDLQGKSLANPYLSIHHDEDAEVYLNGRLVARLTGYTTDYVQVTLDESARAALKPGINCLAVHCHQTGGGQYIDVGLVDMTERPQQSY